LELQLPQSFLPYKKKALFEASPIAQMKVAGIPLITIAGVILWRFPCLSAGGMDV